MVFFNFVPHLINSFLRLLWGTPFPNWLRHDLSTGLFFFKRIIVVFRFREGFNTNKDKEMNTSERKWKGKQLNGNEIKENKNMEKKKATSKRWTTLSTTPPLSLTLGREDTLFTQNCPPYSWPVGNPAVLNPLKVGCLPSRERSHISPTNFVLKMMFLFPR